MQMQNKFHFDCSRLRLGVIASWLCFHHIFIFICTLHVAMHMSHELVSMYVPSILTEFVVVYRGLYNNFHTHMYAMQLCPCPCRMPIHISHSLPHCI